MKTIEIVRVKFLWPAKIYEFSNPSQLSLKRDDFVVVETQSRGTKVGKVVVAPRVREMRQDDATLSPVLRLATDQDIQLEKVRDEFKYEVKNFFNLRVRARELRDVKFIDCEKADGGRKLILYFQSENKRFDVREMAKEVGTKYGMRVDLRSVGIRDAARLTGGIGRCGLSTCCSTWLPDFAQISIKMAKDQGLSLDPDGISGQCGRLLCCLGYEHENYLALGKDLPKVGKVVITPKGDARVMKLDVLKQKITVKLIEGSSYEVFEGSEVKRKFGPQSNQRNDDGGDEGNEDI